MNPKKYFYVLVLTLLSGASLAQSNGEWSTDFNAATALAKEEHKLVLLNFSGSDWCAPCIKFKKDVLSSDTLRQYAVTNLVLVNADFPRMKKNAADKSLAEQNDKLAEQYNHEGIFPYTVLLDANAAVIKAWPGNPGLSPEQFVNQIDHYVHDGH